MLRKPGYGDCSQFGMTEFDKPKDILSDMLRATEPQFKGKATESNKLKIADALVEAGFQRAVVIDWLPHLMYHLGADTEKEVL